MRKNRYIYKEVLPVELPLNFSNSFLRLISHDGFTSKTLEKNYTIPLNFKVPKTNGLEQRMLSIPHPIAQIQMMAYLNTYKFNIMNFCSLSPFSIRSPQKLNNLNFNYDDIYKNKIKFFNSLFDEKSSDLKINKTDLNIEFTSFFSYRKFNNILQFKNSISYHRAKIRFDNYMNLDIRNFFSSIYTHSLEWAITDNIKKTKQELQGDNDFFRKITDKICQTINYNETNGIIVGPEFSRIISEILLTRTDLQIAKKLNEEGLKYNKDYVIYRFIDDYTIFFNKPSEQNEKLIKNTIIDVLSQYKLQLNTEKFITKNALLVNEDTSIIELKNILSSFIIDFNKNFKFDQLNNIASTFMINFAKLISIYPNKKVSIVRYTLKKFTELIPKNLNSISRQLVLDLAFFVLSYSPEHFSVQNMNNLIFNYREAITKHFDTSNKYLEEFDTEYINRLIKFLKRNKFSLDQIYELITAAKYLSIKLPNNLLCSFVQQKNSKNNYFILCTIANYILDSKNPYRLLKSYKIVFEKISKEIDRILKEQSEDHLRFIDSNYFYIINDFTYYPLFQKNKFSTQKTKDLLKKLKSEHKHFLQMAKEKLAEGFSITGKSEMESFVKPIISRSYYRWNIDYSFYAKTNILKSLNSYKNSPNIFNYN
ncbi:RNA-directed DNA polymerase [Bacillus sp. RC250]|uniref:RNA-directed DNA polymerase n=1 Tax=Bacillus sp. RC250 TaxID=3156287 RepID=UPI003834DF28